MQKGIIVKNISNLYNVETENNIFLCEARGKFKKSGITPAVGDRVQINSIDEQKGIIEEVLERSNYIKRPKIANLTQIVFVLSMSMPKPDLLLLDKQLAFAEYLHIEPIIVLNKIDLDEKEEFNKISQTYRNIGYKVIKTNAKEKIGIQKLEQELKDNISAFSGNSGVGKSTLINDLFNENITEEGEISQKNKRGKNTTTHIKLYELNKDTYIADTPGFSTFDVYEIPYKELDKYFVEFKNGIENCRYIGCSHIKEDECGVKDLIEENKIDRQRYENYIKIYEELKDKEEHKW